MKKLALGALCLAGFLAACGGGDDGGVTPVPDANTNPPIDGPPVTLCNPLAPAGMQGCNAGQKCTWVTITESPDAIGKIACVADGTVDLAGACTNGAAGEATGFDNCKAGNICVAGTCKDVCGFGGGAAEACAAGQACTRYSDLWANGDDDPMYGACNPTCNPVTQMRADGSNCGMNQGCYLLVSSTTSTAVCAGAGMTAHNVEITGTAFANSCVPGAQPRRKLPTAMTSECGGLCDPKDVFVTLPADVRFDTTRTPPNAYPLAPVDTTKVTNFASESGTPPNDCFNKWGAAPASNTTVGEGCRRWWAREPFDDLSPFSNSVGWCFKHAVFMFDSNGDMTADAPFPRCAALPGCVTPNCTTADLVLPIGNPPHEDATFFWCRALPTMLTTSIKHTKKSIEHSEPRLDRLGNWR